MSDDLPIPKAIWTGSFPLFGTTIHCAVLDNGIRVINAESLELLLDAMAEGEEANPEELENFARWQRGEL